jgi:hypothetical protein
MLKFKTLFETNTKAYTYGRVKIDDYMENIDRIDEAHLNSLIKNLIRTPMTFVASGGNTKSLPSKELILKKLQS